MFKKLLQAALMTLLLYLAVQMNWMPEGQAPAALKLRNLSVQLVPSLY